MEKYQTNGPTRDVRPSTTTAGRMNKPNNQDTLKGVNLALDHFRTKYQERFGVEPVIKPGYEANSILMPLIRDLGLKRVTALITHYLSMNNPWFQSKGYSLAVFNSEIGAVNSSFGEQTKKATSSGQGVYMRVEIYCSECLEKSEFVLPISADQSAPRLCDSCRMKAHK